jgi:hypothetical protein
MDEAPPLGPGIDDAETRMALKRYERRAWPLLVLGLLLAYATVFAMSRQGHHHNRGVGFLGGLSVSCLIWGLAVIVRHWRWRRLLSAARWRSFQVRAYWPAVEGKADPGVVLGGDDQTDTHPVALRVTAVRWRRAALSQQATVWVCGDLGNKAVLAIPGTCSLYGVEPPRGPGGWLWKRGHRRELAALAAGIEQR